MTQRARNAGEGECQVCGTSFAKYTARNVYCSESCRWKAMDARRDEAAKQKRLERMRKWGAENQDKRRNYHYKRNYGITLEEYNEMLAGQNGACKICKESPKEHHRALAVDHDHKTGEIFGLLCTPCNKNLIGKIRDSSLFDEAAKYLQKGTGRFVPEEFKNGQKKRRRKTARKVKTLD